MYGSRKSKLLREAALEFRDRLERSKFRADAVWNEAVHACMDKIGKHHDPRHEEGCTVCWVRRKLGQVLKLEASGYVPVKERMKNSLGDLRESCQLRGPERTAFLDALDGAEKVFDGLLEDFE